MSTRELTEQLIEVLEREADGFDRLATAMHGEREAFVAVRTGELEAGLPGLLSLAEEALGLARRRERVAAALGGLIGHRGPLTRSALARHLPADQRARFESAARRAGESATRARVESRIGNQLLGLSRRWRESLFGSVPDGAADAVVYDRSARTHRAARTGGSLVRGTI